MNRGTPGNSTSLMIPANTPLIGAAAASAEIPGLSRAKRYSQ